MARGGAGFARDGRRPKAGAYGGALRFFYLAMYAAFAACGAALLARPALRWFLGLGFFSPALPASGFAGLASAALLFLLVAATLAMAIKHALGHKPGLPAHAAFLGLVACALAVRAASVPAPPVDPDPALREALRAAAGALDASYAVEHRYDPGVNALQAALDALPPSPFRHRAKSLRYSARVLRNAPGPQNDPLPGDLPATVYVAIEPGGQGAWLSATTLRNGRVEVLPAAIQARSGTHSEPGESLLLPRYPGMRSAPR
ncbi:MAG: hypothetical protein E6J85_00645 [Deltaproteobacteria bacterium]|nr:MAG: hypothetical protein E6J85_00645 [Deltaproteobacteria bacterium]